MKTKFGIPVKPFRILTLLLNDDKEIYTRYLDRWNIIDYKDLVQTLKINPDLSKPPIVELEDYGYMVRGNNIFFQAAKEAGVKSLICDLNMKTLKDKHMSQFQLLDVNPDENPYCAHLIFFLDIFDHNKNFHNPEVMESINKKLVTEGFDDTLKFEFVDFSVAEIKVPLQIKNPYAVVVIAKNILSGIGKIRSINGQRDTTDYPLEL